MVKRAAERAQQRQHSTDLCQSWPRSSTASPRRCQWRGLAECEVNGEYPTERFRWRQHGGRLRGTHRRREQTGAATPSPPTPTRSWPAARTVPPRCARHEYDTEAVPSSPSSSWAEARPRKARRWSEGPLAWASAKVLGREWSICKILLKDETTRRRRTLNTRGAALKPRRVRQDAYNHEGQSWGISLSPIPSVYKYKMF
jgi:hypothetical protein